MEGGPCVALVSRKSLRDARFAVRRATATTRLLPDWLVIGAQKAGTTSLYYYLVEHPDIAPAFAEEVHFFDQHWADGLDWYRANFPLAVQRPLRKLRGLGCVVGEATPYYLFHPAVPERVRATVPDARLVVLLRNPIDRAYSQYQHGVRRGRETLSFEAAIDAERERLGDEESRLRRDPAAVSAAHQHFSYIARGHYEEQLRAWHRHFPVEQIYVESAEAFQRETGRVFAEIVAFLGLRAWTPREFPRHNAWRYPPMAEATRTRLEAYFRPHNEKLYELLGRDLGWSR
jgi:hypothetical protein